MNPNAKIFKVFDWLDVWFFPLWRYFQFINPPQGDWTDYPMGPAFNITDPEAPAFIRKRLGIPLGFRIMDPETPAFMRKRVGLKLEEYHLGN